MQHYQSNNNLHVPYFITIIIMFHRVSDDITGEVEVSSKIFMLKSALLEKEKEMEEFQEKLKVYLNFTTMCNLSGDVY